MEVPAELIPNLDDLVTEDGKAADNLYVGHCYRLLTEPLASSWPGPGEGRPFVVLANVGWFPTPGRTPLVPDVLLSLDVTWPQEPRAREGRSYFQWIYGKQPDVVIEIVSDKRGDEAGLKMRSYARLGVSYYAIFDPDEQLAGGVLRAFELRGKRYHAIEPRWLEDIGLGLTLWTGTYGGIQETWLRWCDVKGVPIPTGAERADRAEARAERLAARLRELGIDPEA
jgi:Uma2 family endonuclease